MTDSTCPGTDLNRYDRCGSQDFKSCVSTNSTTRAIEVFRFQLAVFKYAAQTVLFFFKKNPPLREEVFERKTGLEPATSTLARSRSTK
jgi:hypothetical protein